MADKVITFEGKDYYEKDANTISIHVIEKIFGLDKVEPIKVNSKSVEEDLERDADYYRDWYEEELRVRFKELFLD